MPEKKSAQQTVAPTPAPAAANTDNAAAAAAAAANAIANQPNGAKQVKKVIGVINTPETMRDVTLGGDQTLRNADEPVHVESPSEMTATHSMPTATLPVNQPAANVPLDAYEFDPTKGAMAPVKRVQIPVEPLPATSSADADQFELPLNKTRPIELDRAVRDVIIVLGSVATIVLAFDR